MSVVLTYPRRTVTEYLLGISINDPYFVEPEGSPLSPSQKPATVLYPEPHESDEHFPILFEIHFDVLPHSVSSLHPRYKSECFLLVLPSEFQIFCHRQSVLRQCERHLFGTHTYHSVWCLHSRLTAALRHVCILHLGARWRRRSIWWLQPGHNPCHSWRTAVFNVMIAKML